MNNHVNCLLVEHERMLDLYQRLLKDYAELVREVQSQDNIDVIRETLEVIEGQREEDGHRTVPTPPPST